MVNFYRIRRVKLYPELMDIVLIAAESSTYPLEYKTYYYHQDTKGFDNKLRELYESICDGELFFPYLKRTRIFTDAMYSVSVHMLKDGAIRLPTFHPFKLFWNTPYYEGIKEKYYLVWIKSLKKQYEMIDNKNNNIDTIIKELDNIIKYKYKQKKIKGRTKWPF